MEQQENPPQSQQPAHHAPPPKQGMSAGKIIMIVVATVGTMTLGTCAVCTCMVGGAASSLEKERKAKEKREDEMLKDCSSARTIAWSEIARDLEENEARVASEWKGACAKVNGIVHRINSDFSDKPYVVINSGEQLTLHNLRCKPENHEKALNLAKGQQITVWGIGGNEVIGSLELNRCQW